MSRLIRRANTPMFNQVPFDTNMDDLRNHNLGMLVDNDDWKLANGVPGDKEMGTAGVLAFDRDIVNDDGAYRVYLIEVFQFQHTQHTETMSAVLVYELTEQGTVTPPAAYVFRSTDTAHTLVPQNWRELAVPNGPVLVGLRARTYADAIKEIDNWKAEHGVESQRAATYMRRVKAMQYEGIRYVDLDDKAKTKAQSFLFDVIFGDDHWYKYTLEEGLQDIHAAGFDVDDDEAYFDVDYSQNAHIEITLPKQYITDVLVNVCTGKMVDHFAKVIAGDAASFNAVAKVKDALMYLEIEGKLTRRTDLDMDDEETMSMLADLIDDGELDPMAEDRANGVLNTLLAAFNKKGQELAEALFNALRDESDYLSTDEYLADFADANEFFFTKRGYPVD